MRKSTRSILQELSDLGISRDKDQVIESRGANLIESAINYLLLENSMTLKQPQN